MQVFWLEAQPWDYVAGAATTVRVCSSDLSPIVLFGGVESLPVLEDGPKFSTNVFNGSFAGTTTSSFGVVTLAAGPGEIDAWAKLAWGSRPVQVYCADIDVSNPVAPVFPTTRTLLFDGVSESFDPDQAQLNLTMTPPTGLVANQIYAGTGGLEGTTSLANLHKAFSIGKQVNRPAQLVDSSKLLFRVNAAGALDTIEYVRERGVKLDQPFIYHTTFADLNSATIPATEIHVHLASGSFRVGFQPYGDITADYHGKLTGYAYPAGVVDIVTSVLIASGWNMSKVDATSFSTVAALLPYEGQYHDDTGKDVATALDEIMQGCAGYWDVDALGNFYIGVFKINPTADFTIGDEGLATYDVLETDYLPTRAPFWKNRVSWGFNADVMTFSDTEAGATPDQLTTIQNVQGLVNGQLNVFFATTAPTSGMISGDLWYNSSTGNWYKYDGTTWNLTAGLGALGDAIVAAAGAQATADGKITSYYTDSTPSSPHIGDLWTRPSDVPKVTKRWNGSTWDPVANNVTQGTDIGVANGATADIALTAVGSCTVLGNTVTMGGSASYSYFAVGQAMAGASYAACDIPTSTSQYAAVALDDDSTTGGYASWNAFALYSRSGNGQLYINGTLRASITTTNLIGKLTLLYDGVNVSAYAGATLIGTYALTFAGAIYPKWSPPIAATVNTGLRQGPANDVSWANIQGTGRPADNATVNRIFVSATAPVGPVDGDSWVVVSPLGFTFSAATPSPTGATFSRSSTALAFDVTGVYATFAIDAIRIEYDPVSHAYLGVRIEPAATNLLRKSQNFNSTWTPSSATTVVVDQINGLDGTLSADLIKSGSGSGNQTQQQTVTLAAGTYTLSNYFKAKEYTKAVMVSTADGTFPYAILDLSAVTITKFGGSSIAAARITPMGNGYYRGEIVFTVAAGSNTQYIGPSNSSTNYTYSGDGTSGGYAWQAQLELGTVASSPILTTTAAVTRSADVWALPWGSIGVPNVTTNIRYFFDDGSYQDRSTVIASGMAAVPTDLNRVWLKSAQATAYYSPNVTFMTRVGGAWVSTASLGAVVGTNLVGADGTNLTDAMIRNLNIAIDPTTGIVTGIGSTGIAIDNSKVPSAVAQTTKTIAADYTGAIPSTSLPATVAAPKVTVAGVDVSTTNAVSYAVQNATGGCVGYVSVDTTNGSSTKGVQTIASGFSATGTYELVITVSGVALAPIKVTVTKTVADAPTGGGGGGSTSGSFPTSGYSTNSTSYTEVGRVSGLTVATGKVISAYLSDEYYITTTSHANTTRTMSAKWQYSVAGANSWTDFTTAVTGSAATFSYFSGDNSPGSITANQAPSSPPAAGSYDVRLVMIVSSALSGGAAYMNGDANASVIVS